LILVKEELISGPASRQDHIDIADAVADQDADRAQRLTREHIARSRVLIARIMSSRPGAETSQ
jgi:DNA-binding GntR family transcriptional regulator